MGRRYERGATAAGAGRRRGRPETDEDRAQAAWKALDRGDDPDPTGTRPIRTPHSGTRGAAVAAPRTGGRRPPLEWVH